VALFAALISVIAVIVAGLAPSLLNSRVHLSVAMKEGGRSSTKSGKHGRLRTIFVASEVALALVLVIASLLTVRSFYRMLHADPGFNGQNLLTARIALPEPRYSGATGQRFFAELMDRVRALPGVQSVAATAFVPLGEGGQTGDFQVEGRPRRTEGPFAEEHFVAGDFFRTLQIPLLRGRFFTDADREGTQKVVVINDYMANQVWPGEDPIGKRIQIRSARNDWSVVVGVVGEVKANGVNVPSATQIYLPSLQHQTSDMFLLVRAANDPGGLIPAVKNAVFSLDSQQPVANIALMEELRWRSMSASRSSTSLLGIFASVALLLAAMGIYAVMAYSVGQRVNEIGIRMALGAQNLDIQRLIMRMCLPICGWGLGIGLLGAAFVTRLLQNLLFGVTPTDIVTFTLSTILLGGAVVLASYVPARRATKVDPMVALRYE
jgi:putative ABC transport system permease protein